MKRVCDNCHMKGIKVGKVVLTGPTQCEACGTKYEVARFKNVPHIAAGAVALLFVLAWISNILNITVFLILSGVWLLVDFVWESLVPLTPVENPPTSKPM